MLICHLNAKRAPQQQQYQPMRYGIHPLSPCGNRSEDLPLGSDCIDGNLGIPVGLKSILFWVVDSI